MLLLIGVLVNCVRRTRGVHAYIERSRKIVVRFKYRVTEWLSGFHYKCKQGSVVFYVLPMAFDA
jgi:hypothetical protein